MSLTSLDYKNQGNQYYSNQQSSLAIQSYSQAIQLIENNPHEEDSNVVSLYLLYSNRSAAHIQDKDYYCGYQDAKQSLKLKRNENYKGFYRLAICTYHLGFIEESKELIKEAIDKQNQNLNDYTELKMLIEKKEKCMKKWRKPVATAKKCLKNLEKIIEKGVLWMEIPSVLYQIRYLLRCYFEDKQDKKLMNMNHGDLGLRLHELAVEFNVSFNVEKMIMLDPIFEDLILNEMPDVGSLRLKAYEQRKLPRDQRDYDLEEEVLEDLTAYEFSFFINNILASLVANASNKQISLRALRQLHRLTTNDLYRQSLGDALSDAISNYIYRQYQNVSLVEKFLSHFGIEILIYDYLEAACEFLVSRMIKQITISHWKKQSSSTIQLVIKQISKKIRQKGTELIEQQKSSRFVAELKQFLTSFDSVDNNINNDDDDEEKDLNLIINVLTKIYFVFGQEPFINQSLHDPFFLYVKQTWFLEMNQNSNDISFLLNGWKLTLTKWLQLDYKIRRHYFQQINDNDD